MGDQGFDDQFNDGLFKTTLHNSSLRRPSMWPKSVSEMRHHTSYAGQGMPREQDTGHSDFMIRRPSARRGGWLYVPTRHKWVWVDTR